MLFDFYKLHLSFWNEITLKTKLKGYAALFLQILNGFTELFFAYISLSILGNIIDYSNSNNFFINKSLEELIIYLILSIIFTTAIRALVSKFNVLFGFNVCKDISLKLYDLILNLDFQEISNINSSNYISSLTTKMYRISYFYVSILQIISSLIIFSFLSFSFIFFLKISFFNTLALLIVLFFISYLINLLLKKKINLLSSKVNNEMSNMQRVLEDTNIFIKEIFLNNYFNIFKKDFYLSSSSLYNLEAKTNYLVSLPKILIETILMIIGALLLLIFSSQEDLLLKIGYSFFMFLRLFPHLNVINTNLNLIRSIFVPIKSIANLIKNYTKQQNLIDENENKIFQENFNSLKIKKLFFSFKENSVLENIDLKIKKNNLLVITGISGSGKTTLLNILCGFIKPKKGEIFYNEKVINNFKNNFWQKKIAYVSQNIPLFDRSLIYNITLDENYDLEKNYNEFKKILDLSLINWISDVKSLQKNIGEHGQKLSGGQKQRLALARALYQKNKEILILDEVTSALDFESEKILVEKFKELKKKYTIISVTHRKAILEIADSKLDLS